MTDTSPPTSQATFDRNQIDAFLVQLARNAAFDGWSEKSVSEACHMAGIEPLLITELFPAGIPDMILGFSDWADRQMTIQIKDDTAFATKKIREKISQLIMVRFTILAPYKASLSAASKKMSHPRHARRVQRAVWRTADQMWYLAGDQSTDFNFYTKRTLLCSILVASGVFWLRDTSPTAKKTQDFVNQRIAHILRWGKLVGGCKARCGTLSQRVKQGFDAFFPAKWRRDFRS